MADPRNFDLRVRTVTTAIVSMVIIGVAAYEAVTKGAVDSFTTAWGGIILGVYFGAHVSQNGAGIRARRDQQILAEAQAPVPTAPAPETAA